MLLVKYSYMYFGQEDDCVVFVLYSVYTVVYQYCILVFIPVDRTNVSTHTT